ncbi:MAG: hypothetical protein IIW03_05450 [Clostridia bacterium]|mgnify:CR=1 FL=1|nr:hypothetical protein [Clostridia bacterium]
MPTTKFQRTIFALITVVITVHAFVFYNLYVVEGEFFRSIAGATGVLDGIYKNGGVMMFGRTFPIWAVVLLEFVLAFTLENVMGSPCSFKLATKVFDPKTTHPVIFECAIISATVALMCPAMSFLAAIIYYPYFVGFDVLTLLANWVRLVCFNFPFALFSQLFFIQPLVRKIFKALFKKA